jgi:nitrate reductase molybdenum cofactor assembly chaperone NarJ/NarW
MTDRSVSTSPTVAASRLAASWLLWYPDEELLARLDDIAAVSEELPERLSAPMRQFLQHVHDVALVDLQKHYVSIFDMKRKACPYLTYWTDGDTRNRGNAILRFRQAYRESGFTSDSRELPDHLSVVLEFAAVGDPLTGDALLAEHQAPIRLLRDALDRLGSAYVHVLDLVIATLPEASAELRARMAQLAASGPPAEQVGLEPFSLTLEPIGGRR